VSASGVRGVKVSKVTRLRAREQRLLDMLSAVRTELAAEEVKAQTSPTIDQARWRTAVRELGTFTVDELAAEVGSSYQTAKRHVDELLEVDVIVTQGKVLGRYCYSFVRPEGPGAAFTAQTALRVVPSPEKAAVADMANMPRGAPVAGTGGGLVSELSAKDVRDAVKDAQRCGWMLIKKGDGHFVLTKGRQRVQVALTPQNASTQAARIRRQTRTKVKVPA
jgi:hypothetical protein